MGMRDRWSGIRRRTADLPADHRPPLSGTFPGLVQLDQQDTYIFKNRQKVCELRELRDMYLLHSVNQ
jgi:hypothetical protein